MRWYSFLGYHSFSEAVWDLRRKGYSDSEILELEGLVYEELDPPLLELIHECPNCHQLSDTEWWKMAEHKCPNCGYHDTSQEDEARRHMGGAWRRVPLLLSPKGHQGIVPRGRR